VFFRLIQAESSSEEPSRPLGQITAGSLVTRPAAWAGESDADNAKVSIRTVARRARRIPVPRPGRHRTSPSWANYVPCSLCIEASRPLTMCISSRTGEPVLSKPWSTGLVAMALRPNLMAPARWHGFGATIGYVARIGSPLSVRGLRGRAEPTGQDLLGRFRLADTPSDERSGPAAAAPAGGRGAR